MFYYYEGGCRRTVSRRMAYHLYRTAVGVDQKRAGTTFQTWLAEMIKMQIFVPV